MTRTLPQLSIWTAAPWSDPDTSRDAARAIEPHLQRLEQEVVDTLDAHPAGGMTTQELERYLCLSGNTIRPRLVALRARGLVVKTAERRRTASGRMAAVWRRA